MRRLRISRSLGASLSIAAACTTHGDVLWDNGVPDGVGGYSNGTINAFGARRALLDDFTIPAGQIWQVSGFHWRSVWGTPGGGVFGTGMELSFRSDAGGRPGDPITGLANITAYSEVDTGMTFFSREVHQHWAQFDVVTLKSGTYWWEGTVVGPENNFWLTAPQRDNECWVNYSDFNGLESGTHQFGVPSDMNWMLDGTLLNACTADLDGDTNVGFGDLLLVLGAWGECFHHSGCPEDIDDSGAVDFGDVLAVISEWGGPCAPAITGACCFDDATCTDVTHAVCLSVGGRFLGPETVCADGCPGACCFDDGACADGVAEDDCVAMLGHFAGEAVRCDEIDCPLIPVGACCLDDGTCAGPVSESNCALLDGRYQGDGTFCNDVECAELGPCGWIVDAPLVWSDDTCFGDDSCSLRPSRDVQWAVTIPVDGTWTFSVCGAGADTFLFVDTIECCGAEHFDDDFCAPASELTLDLAGGQVVFVTLETQSFIGCGDFTLVVSGPPPFQRGVGGG